MAEQYFGDQLSRDLKDSNAQHKARDNVFHVAPRYETARIQRSDLEEARALWLETEGTEAHSDFLTSPNSHGEVIDFHALRHTCGAWLAMAGVTILNRCAVRLFFMV